MHILTLTWNVDQARPKRANSITLFHEMGIVTASTVQFKKKIHKEDQELAQDRTNCMGVGPKPGLGPNPVCFQSCQSY